MMGKERGRKKREYGYMTGGEKGKDTGRVRKEKCLRGSERKWGGDRSRRDKAHAKEGGDGRGGEEGQRGNGNTEMGLLVEEKRGVVERVWEGGGGRGGNA